MITFQHPEYGRLAGESSDLMIRHDAAFAEGDLEEAGRAILEAGEQRRAMSKLSSENDDPSKAMGDALSAAACFVAGGDLPRARESLADAERIAPHVPANRLDLHEEIPVRQREVRRLERRQKAFAKAVREHPEWLSNPDDGALEFARKQLDWFPGWGLAYSLLAKMEAARGNHEAAARHARAAVKFDSEQPPAP